MVCDSVCVCVWWPPVSVETITFTVLCMYYYYLSADAGKTLPTFSALMQLVG